MAVLKLEQARRSHLNPQQPEVGPDQTSTTHVAEVELTGYRQSSAVSAEQGWVEAIRAEMDEYVTTLKALTSMTPEEIFSNLSGITARLCELRLATYRNESRRLTSLRTHEIDPILDQCDRAFRIHSRIQSTRQMEWDHLRTQT